MHAVDDDRIATLRAGLAGAAVDEADFAPRCHLIWNTANRLFAKGNKARAIHASSQARKRITT